MPEKKEQINFNEIFFTNDEDGLFGSVDPDFNNISQIKIPIGKIYTKLVLPFSVASLMLFSVYPKRTLVARESYRIEASQTYVIYDTEKADSSDLNSQNSFNSQKNTTDQSEGTKTKKKSKSKNVKRSTYTKKEAQKKRYFGDEEYVAFYEQVLFGKMQKLESHYSHLLHDLSIEFLKEYLQKQKNINICETQVSQVYKTFFKLKNSPSTNVIEKKYLEDQFLNYENQIFARNLQSAFNNYLQMRAGFTHLTKSCILILLINNINFIEKSLEKLTLRVRNFLLKVKNLFSPNSKPKFSSKEKKILKYLFTLFFVVCLIGYYSKNKTIQNATKDVLNYFSRQMDILRLLDASKTTEVELIEFAEKFLMEEFIKSTNIPLEVRSYLFNILRTQGRLQYFLMIALFKLGLQDASFKGQLDLQTAIGCIISATVKLAENANNLKSYAESLEKKRIIKKIATRKDHLRELLKKMAKKKN